jgi:hypothetical protein
VFAYGLYKRAEKEFKYFNGPGNKFSGFGKTYRQLPDNKKGDNAQCGK